MDHKVMEMGIRLLEDVCEFDGHSLQPGLLTDVVVLDMIEKECEEPISVSLEHGNGVGVKEDG